MIEIINKAVQMPTKRSEQVTLGPSEVGGCRRRAWMRSKGHPEINSTLGLSAWIGTAIHDKLEKFVRYLDPFGERYLVEHTVWSDDPPIRGHVDVFDCLEGQVIDWKTTTKAKLSAFPSEQQRWQVQLYGWLLESMGETVNTVTLVAIPRDADERYIKQHSEPYDAEIALEAVSWLTDVLGREDAPEPEKTVNFCRFYCGFFDEEGVKGCSGIKKS